MSKAALLHLSKADKILADLIRRIGPCGLAAKQPKTKGPHLTYRALVEAVVYQQLTGKAAATILGRVKALYPKRKFPTAADILATPDEKLRAAGLSRSKTAALKDIAAKSIDGTIPTTIKIGLLSDLEVVERLTLIRGVGPWTAEMVLMFTLGRPDVLPVTDYGVRKGFATLYRKKDLPTPAELLAHGEKWRPYRSIAAWYLWRAADLK